MDTMTRTGKLKFCVDEASAKKKPFLKELTTNNTNEKENLDGPQLVGSNSRKLLKSMREKGEIANKALSLDPLI